MISLLIDEGIESRGHRKAMLSTDIRMCGISYMKGHPVYNHSVVLNYASYAVEKGELSSSKQENQIEEFKESLKKLAIKQFGKLEKK